MISGIVESAITWQSLVEMQTLPRVPNNNDDQEDEDEDEEEEDEKREPAVIREPDKDQSGLAVQEPSRPVVGRRS